MELRKKVVDRDHVIQERDKTIKQLTEEKEKPLSINPSNFLDFESLK